MVVRVQRADKAERPLCGLRATQNRESGPRCESRTELIRCLIEPLLQASALQDRRPVVQAPPQAQLVFSFGARARVPAESIRQAGRELRSTAHLACPRTAKSRSQP